MSETHGYGIGAFIEMKKLIDLDVKRDGEGTLSGDFERLEIGGGIARTLKASTPGTTGNHNTNVIMEISVIGRMDNTLDHTFESANRVYGVNGVSPTINTCGGGGLEPKVMEVQMVRMVGRDPENPTSRKPSDNYEQMLEVKQENICGTLTSVQKDNLVMEKKSIKIKENNKRGYDDCEIGGVADLNYASSTTRRGRVQDNGTVSPTLATENMPYRIELGNPDFYHFIYLIDDEYYLIRIRKLIPKECWRLMGFTDEQFEAAEKVNSNTQLYKEAGNSICVPVLMAIFSQMGIGGRRWNNLSEDERYEMIRSE